MSKKQKYQIELVNVQILEKIIADFDNNLSISDDWIKQHASAFGNGKYKTLEVSHTERNSSSAAKPPSYSDAPPKTYLPLMNNNGLTLVFSPQEDPNARVVPPLAQDYIDFDHS